MKKLSVLLLSMVLFTERGLAQDLTTQRQIFFSNAVANNSGGMANTLLAMAVASIGSVIPDTCVKQSGVLPGEPLLPLSADILSRVSLAYIAAEVQAANEHKTDIEERNAAVQTIAQRMKIQSGGEAQKVVFVEAKKEREYLHAFTDMREIMITPLIAGFNAAANQALDEDETPENTIICTGTLPAALIVAQNLGSSFQATVGVEPAQTVMSSLGGVVQIVALQILPMLQTPSGRAMVGIIAAEAASRISGELINARSNLDVNIADIGEVIRGFESDLGVPSDTGVNAPKNESGTRPEDGNVAGPRAIGVTNATATAGSANVTVGGTANSGVRKTTGTCAVKSGKSVVFKEVCTNPVELSEVAANRAKSENTKNVILETTRMVNALAKGDVNAAKVAAVNLGNLSAAVKKDSTTKLTNRNTLRLRSGKQMLDLDGSTKKKIAEMTTEIQAEVTKRGGEKLLASTSTGNIPKAEIKLDLPEKTEEFDEASLSPRLRGKRAALLQASRVETAKKEETKAAEVTEPKTIWEQLTNRYQAQYEKLEKKKP